MSGKEKKKQRRLGRKGKNLVGGGKELREEPTCDRRVVEAETLQRTSDSEKQQKKKD